MSRFTSLQVSLILAFCIYWFIFFPLMWFVWRPSIFMSDIWQALLFAILLFVCYCILHVFIICCCERRQKRKAQAAALPMKHVAQHPEAQPARVQVPDAVLYQKPHCGGNGVHCPHMDPDYEQPPRFISSYELYYDGRKFRNDGTEIDI